MNSHTLQVQKTENTQQTSSKKESEPTGRTKVAFENPSPFFITGSDLRGNIQLTPQNILYVQRTIGNQAVGRIIQAKLRVGQPGDKYEREADRVAEQVMRMPEPRAQRQAEEEEKEEEVLRAKPLAKQITPLIQRQVEEEEEEEGIQTKPIASQITPLIQRQAEPEEEEKEPIQMQLVSLGHPILQKQEEPEEEEETVQPKELTGHTPGVSPNDILHRQPDEEEEEPIQAKSLIQKQLEEEEEEEVQAKSLIQLQAEKEEEEPVQTKPIANQITHLIQRQAEPELEEEEPIQELTIQRQEEEKEEEGAVQELAIQRQEEGEEEEEEVQRKSLIQRQAEKEEELVQAKSENTFERIAPASLENTIRGSKTSGVPLTDQTRAEMETHFGADFSKVRIHNDAGTTQMNRAVSAQAFTHGSHIYFGAGNYNPQNSAGKRLLAHELTHVVQQGAAMLKKPVPVTRSPRSIQRLPKFITSRLNRYARHIPGYTLLTVIIGFNPLTGRSVERTAENLLGGLMGLVPFGTALYDKLTELGIVGRALSFVRNELARFDLSLERLERTIKNAWDEMDFIRLDPFDYNLRVLRRHFSGLLADIRGFASSVANRALSMIKEALISALRRFAGRIPGYSLFAKILGRDPLTGESIQRNTADIIEEFLILIGRRQHLEKMRETGTIQRVAKWIDTQLALLNFSFAEIRALFTEAWNAFSFRDVTNPIGAFNRTVNIFRPFLSRIFTFAYNVASTVLRFIKDAVLGALSRFARRVPGFTLLTVILGRDPFTGNPVARTATNLIRGFMEFIPGGEEKFRNLQESGAIDRALQWLEGELAKLNLNMSTIIGLFTTAWQSLSIRDLINPVAAFRRMVGIFGPTVRRIINFAVPVGKKVLQFVFEGALRLAGPAGKKVMDVIRKGKETFWLIVNDPIGFLGNLLKAVGQGFKQFSANIWTHLKKGLLGWLFGTLSKAGITMPEKFDLKGILSLVLQILGLTYDNIRVKLVKLLGEPTVKFLEKAFEFVKILVTEGLAGAWKKIMEYMGSLKDMVIGAIRDWVITTIIKSAITKLATMFNPVGAIIQAIITIYNTVMFFIERAQQIMALANAVFDSVVNIAKGQVQAAAGYVEMTMARTIPVIISFLARLIGLGGIAGKIKDIIKKIQLKVSKALDKVIGFIAKHARKLFGRGKPAEKRVEPGKHMDERIAKQTVRNALDTQLPKGAKQAGDVAKALASVAPKVRPNLTRLQVEEVMPGKPKKEGAIGFKVKGNGKSGAVLIASVPFSAEGEVLTPEERWKKGVGGVKKAVVRLLKRDISEKTIRNQFPKWEPEYGFKPNSLRLNLEGEKAVIEGSMSPAGQRVIDFSLGGLGNTQGDPVEVEWPDVQYDDVTLITDVSNPAKTNVANPGSKTTLMGKRDSLDVGVASNYLTPKGLFKNRAERGSTKQGTFRDWLSRHGYHNLGNPDPYEADHVVDYRFGGPDETKNLWPLERGKHKQKTSAVWNHMSILKGAFKGLSVKQLRKRGKTYKDRWFKVK